MLRDMFGFPGEATLTYREWGVAPNRADPVEAEELFPPGFLDEFVAEVGEEVAVSEKVRRANGGWRYGFSQAGKQLFIPYVRGNATADVLSRFADVWATLAERITRLEERAARRAEFGSAEAE